MPDWRIEKAALSSKKKGDDVSFAGNIPNHYNRKTFSKIYTIRWSAKARYGIPFFWQSVKKQFDMILKEARPDIVHAHNIFSAKMMTEFDIPFIYDDHEYWSLSSKILNETEKEMPYTTLDNNITAIIRDKFENIRKKYLYKHIINLWSRWEKELVINYPTITVSERIANDLRNINETSTIFIVPNFPLKEEIVNIKKPQEHKSLSSVYAGGDGYNKIRFPQRNIDGFIDTFNKINIGNLIIIGWQENSPHKMIEYKGYLSRNGMFSEMSNHSVGLIPWRKHWAHKYFSPNKAYEYAHAGLFVMCTSSLTSVNEYLKDNCMTFEDYQDMVQKLSYFKDNLNELYNKRLRIFEFAKENLIWENYEDNIFKAYKKC